MLIQTYKDLKKIGIELGIECYTIPILLPSIVWRRLYDDVKKTLKTDVFNLKKDFFYSIVVIETANDSLVNDFMTEYREREDGYYFVIDTDNEDMQFVVFYTL